MNGIIHVYMDKDGGLRLYIPKRMASQLKWKNMQEILASDKDGKIILAEVPE